jgi:Uma2 family endonuclease
MRPNHETIRDNLLYALRGIHPHNEGRVFGPEMNYIVDIDNGFSIPMLSPDVSFVYAEQLTPQTDTLRPFYGFPDLAVVVRQSSHIHYEPHMIRHRYMGRTTGVPELWVMDMFNQSIIIFDFYWGKWVIPPDETNFAPDHLFPGLLIDVGALFAGVLE